MHIDSCVYLTSNSQCVLKARNCLRIIGAIFAFSFSYVFADSGSQTGSQGAVYYNNGEANTRLNRTTGKDEPISFTIVVTGDLPANNARLLINAYDIDEELLAIDHVYFNGQFLGTLAGKSQSASTTAFNIPVNAVKKGINTVSIRSAVLGGGWRIKVKSAHLVIDGGFSPSVTFETLDIINYKTNDYVTITVTAQLYHYTAASNELSCSLNTGERRKTDFSALPFPLHVKPENNHIVRALDDELYMQFNQNDALNFVKFTVASDVREREYRSYPDQLHTVTLSLNYPVDLEAGHFAVQCFLYQYDDQSLGVFQVDRYAVFQHVKNTGPLYSGVHAGHYDIDIDKRLTPIRVKTESTGANIAYQIVDAPKHGSLTGLFPELTYQVDAGFIGHDRFRFHSIDTASENTVVEKGDVILNIRMNTMNVFQDWIKGVAIGHPTINEYTEAGLQAVDSDNLTFINSVMKRVMEPSALTMNSIQSIINAVNKYYAFIKHDSVNQSLNINDYHNLKLWELNNDEVGVFNRILTQKKYDGLDAYDDVFATYKTFKALIQQIHSSFWLGVSDPMYMDIGFSYANTRYFSSIGGLINNFDSYSIDHIGMLMEKIQIDTVFAGGELVIDNIDQHEFLNGDTPPEKIKITKLPQWGALMTGGEYIKDNDAVLLQTIRNGDWVYKPNFFINTPYDYFIYELIGNDGSILAEKIYVINIYTRQIVVSHLKQKEPGSLLDINPVPVGIFENTMSLADIIHHDIAYHEAQSGNNPILFYMPAHTSHMIIKGLGIKQAGLDETAALFDQSHQVLSIVIDNERKRHSGIIRYDTGNSNQQSVYTWKNLPLDGTLHQHYLNTPNHFDGQYQESSLSIIVLDDVVMIKDTSDSYDTAFLAKYFSSTVSSAKYLTTMSYLIDKKTPSQEVIKIPDSASYAVVKLYSSDKENGSNGIDPIGYDEAMAYSDIYIDLHANTVSGVSSAILAAMDSHAISYAFDNYKINSADKIAVLDSNANILGDVDSDYADVLSSPSFYISGNNELIINQTGSFKDYYNTVVSIEFYQRIFNVSSSVLLDTSTLDVVWGGASEKIIEDNEIFLTNIAIPRGAKAAMLDIQMMPLSSINEKQSQSTGYVWIDLINQNTSGVIHDNIQTTTDLLTWQYVPMLDIPLKQHENSDETAEKAIRLSSNHTRLMDFQSPWPLNLRFFVNAESELVIKSAINAGYAYHPNMQRHLVGQINWLGPSPIVITSNPISSGWHLINEKTNQVLIPDQSTLQVSPVDISDMVFNAPESYSGNLELTYKSLNGRVKSKQEILIATEQINHETSEDNKGQSASDAWNIIIAYLNNDSALAPDKQTYTTAGMQTTMDDVNTINRLLKNKDTKSIESVSQFFLALNTIVAYSKDPVDAQAPDVETFNQLSLSQVDESIVNYVSRQVVLQGLNSVDQLQNMADAIVALQSYIETPSLYNILSISEFELAGIINITEEKRTDLHYLMERLNPDTPDDLNGIVDRLEIIHAYLKGAERAPQLVDYVLLGLRGMKVEVLDSFNKEIKQHKAKSFFHVEERWQAMQVFTQYINGSKQRLTKKDFINIGIQPANAQRIKDISRVISETKITNIDAIREAYSSIESMLAYSHHNNNAPGIEHYYALGMRDITNESINDINAILKATVPDSFVLIRNIVERYIRLFSSIGNHNPVFMTAIDYGYLGINVDADYLNELNQAIMFIKPKSITDITAINKALSQFHDFVFHDLEAPEKEDYHAIGVTLDAVDQLQFINSRVKALSLVGVEALHDMIETLNRISTYNEKRNEIDITPLDFKVIGMEGITKEEIAFIKRGTSLYPSGKYTSIEILIHIYQKFYQYLQGNIDALALTPIELQLLEMEFFPDELMTLIERKVIEKQITSIDELIIFIESIARIIRYRTNPEAVPPSAEHYQILGLKSASMENVTIINRFLQSIDKAIGIDRIESMLAVSLKDSLHYRSISKASMMNLTLLKHGLSESDHNEPSMRDSHGLEQISLDHVEKLAEFVEQADNNKKPTAVDDVLSIRQGEAFKPVDVVSNDKDDGFLTVVDVKLVKGEASLNIVDNKVWVKPNDYFDGALLFNYIIADKFKALSKGTVVIQQETPFTPEITLADDVYLDSAGQFTRIPKTFAIAQDHLGKPLLVKRINPVRYLPPGQHAQYWSACDSLFRCAIKRQQITIGPNAFFPSDFTVEEGRSYNVKLRNPSQVGLYRKKLRYEVGGTANSTDHDLPMQGFVYLSDAEETRITVFINQDNQSESEESLILRLYDEENDNLLDQLEMTISEINQPPSASFIMAQGNQSRLVFSRHQGAIKLYPQVEDPNEQDFHRFSWQMDEALKAVFSRNNNEYIIEPSNLSTGVYTITLVVEDNAGKVGEVSHIFRIRSSLPLLSSRQDSDGDGLSDKLEGYRDSNSNGIPDYRDRSSSCHSIPSVQHTMNFMLYTHDDLCLASGLHAMALDPIQGVHITGESLLSDKNKQFANGAYDFVIKGLKPGSAAQVVIPLIEVVSTTAIYQPFDKYGSWVDFLPLSGNKLFTTQGEKGFCPPINSGAWVAGLQPGSWCLKIILVDGGLYDADKKVNGSVSHLAGLTIDNVSKPVAIDDELTVYDKRLRMIDVLSNDQDINQIGLSILTASADLGEVSIDDQAMTLLYSPPADYLGYDRIVYSIQNDKGAADSAEVIVTIDKSENKASVPGKVTPTSNQGDREKTIRVNSGSLSIFGIILLAILLSIRLHVIRYLFIFSWLLFSTVVCSHDITLNRVLNKQPNLSFSWQFGWVSSVNKQKHFDRQLKQQGFDLGIKKMGGNRFMSSWSVAYWFDSGMLIDASVWWVPGMQMSLKGDVEKTSKNIQKLEDILPGANGGYSFSGGYRWQHSRNLTLLVKAGLYYLLASKTKITFDNGESIRLQKDESFGPLVGLAVKYQLSNNWQIGLQWHNIYIDNAFLIQSAVSVSYLLTHGCP